MGLKAAFESYVYILDQEFKPLSRDNSLSSLESFQRLMKPDITKIVIPQGADLSRAIQSQGRVELGELVSCSGAARKPLQSSVIKLEEGNPRRVVLTNVLEAQYNNLLIKVAQEIMKQKQLSTGLLSPDAYLMLTTWQELAKTFRTVYPAEEGASRYHTKVTEFMFDILAEAKAELLGIHSLLKEFEKEDPEIQEFRNKVLFTYITNLLRLSSLGGSNVKLKSAAAAIQINKLMEQDGLTLIPERRYQVNFKKVEAALLPIITELVSVIHSGDKKAARQMLEDYGGVKASMTTVFKRLSDVPLDIKPIFDLEF